VFLGVPIYSTDVFFVKPLYVFEVPLFSSDVFLLSPSVFSGCLFFCQRSFLLSPFAFLGVPLFPTEVFLLSPFVFSGVPLCDIPPLSKDGQFEPGSLRGAIIKVMIHNASRTRMKHMKCSES
jgi:hypothetical protein